MPHLGVSGPWSVIHQFFLRDKTEPVNGYIELPEHSGLGLVIDEELAGESVLE